MSQANEWNALINTRSTQLQNNIDRLTLEKAQVDSRITGVQGGTNPDVVALRAELTAQSNRLGTRISNHVSQKAQIDNRSYVSLSVEQQAVVDYVCTNCSLQVQTMLACSNVDLELAKQRVETACSSVDNPLSLSSEDRDKIWSSTIHRISEGN